MLPLYFFVPTFHPEQHGGLAGKRAGIFQGIDFINGHP
jgi:hypothetical protein